jgi:hypothetical protein
MFKLLFKAIGYGYGSGYGTGVALHVEDFDTKEQADVAYEATYKESSYLQVFKLYAS